jgi:hypothetical protein
MWSFTGTGFDSNFIGGPNLDLTTNLEGFLAGLAGSGAAASTCKSHCVRFAFCTKVTRTVDESPGRKALASEDDNAGIPSNGM